MLSDEQLREYEQSGFIVLPGFLAPGEVQALRAEAHAIFGQQRPEVVRTDAGEPRGAFVMDRYSDLYRKLLGHPSVLAIAWQLLGEPFYCHQYKIMTKQPFGTANHPWHQDHGTWAEIDGMPAPRAITIGIYLEDVTEFNGPLAFIPGSHKHGTLAGVTELRPGRKSKSVMLDTHKLGELFDRCGAVAPKGPAGTALVFNSQVVHGSAPNMSPSWRHIVYISPNPLSNKLVNPTREEMLASRHFEAMSADA